MLLSLLTASLWTAVELTTGLNDAAPDDAAFAAAVTAALATDDKVLHIGPGVVTLSASPEVLRERNPAANGNKDLHGLRITGSGATQTVIRGISVAGFDVFQLNAVSRLTIDSLAIESIKTGTSQVGCNGVSLTNGANQITLRDLHVRSLPYVLLPDRYDGGKGITVQTGTKGVEASDAILMERCRISDCPIGFGLDCDPTIPKPPRSITVVNNHIERCALPFSIGFSSSLPGGGDLPDFQLTLSDNLVLDGLRVAVISRAPRVTMTHNVIVMTRPPSLPDPYQSRFPDLGIVLQSCHKCDVSFNAITQIWPIYGFFGIQGSPVPTSECTIVGNYLYGPAVYGFLSLGGTFKDMTIEVNRVRGSDTEFDAPLTPTP
jgi:hypothetical protein